LRRQAVDTALRLGLPLENEVLDGLEAAIVYARMERRNIAGDNVRIEENARYLQVALARIPERFYRDRIAIERKSIMTTALRPRPETTYSGINVTGFSPSSGSAAGGTTVNIFGVNFKPGVTVAFGGVPSPAVTWNSCARIVAVAPAGSGAVGLTVTNPDGPFFNTVSN